MPLTAGLQAHGLADVAAALAAGITHLGFGIAAGTEPVGNNYSRTAITWNAAVAGLITNNGDLDSPIASGSWGTLTQAHGYDGAGGGANLVIVWDLANALAVGANGFVHIADTLLHVQAA